MSELSNWLSFLLVLLFFPPTWIVIYLLFDWLADKNKKIRNYKNLEKYILELEQKLPEVETGKEQFEEWVEKRTKEIKQTEEKSFIAMELEKKEARKIVEKAKREAVDILHKAEKHYEERIQGLSLIASQKAQGFPWLAKASAEYLEMEAKRVAEGLETKKHPAKGAAEEVRRIAQEKRSVQAEAKILKYQLEYYEALFPWLTEFKNEEIAEELIRIEDSKTKEPEGDRALKWLTEGEYKKYPSREKYQLALDRYWKRKKTKFEVGRDYERYIGWTYEKDGYEVYYQGIIKGFDDLGRDLIVTKGKEVIVVQCKYWARDKTIHEKHVFQLYGTMISHQIENPNLKVSGRFVTSTGLSDRAKKFSDHLGIKISENTRLEEYPCIKCNIAGRDGERIYHLPFDQQYDTTKIEPEKGEFYCRSVAEAEDKGFRRAMRYRGIGVK